MTQLIVFPTPSNATCTLKTDRGDVIPGHPAIHPTGRQGVGFDVPDGHPNGNGCFIEVGGQGFVPLLQRGTLWLHVGANADHYFPWTPGQTAAFVADDFTLTKAGAAMLPLRVQGTSFVQEG